MALAFLIAGCAVQTAAPRPSQSPNATGEQTATPRPTNAADDVVYLRLNDGPTAAIVALDARTGDVLRKLSDGAVSADGRSVYWTDFASGDTRTIVHVADLATGKELQAFQHTGPVTSVVFHNDNKTILSGSAARFGSLAASQFGLRTIVKFLPRLLVWNMYGPLETTCSLYLVPVSFAAGTGMVDGSIAK